MSRRRRARSCIAAVNGTAAGGGYELALACDEILLVDDRSSAVSLPEVPLLAVLPGTGGLTRVVDKRHVRRDLADVFSTKVEGHQGQAGRRVGARRRDRAAAAAFAELVRDRALAAGRRRPIGPTPRRRAASTLDVALEHRVRRPVGAATADATAATAITVRAVRARLRRMVARRRAVSSTTRSSTFASTTPSSARGCCAPRATPTHVARGRRRCSHRDDWLVREVRLFWKRTLKRLDLSARTLVALVDPGQLLRRHAGRARARRRPHAHARRHRRRRPVAAAHRRERRLVSDGQRPRRASRPGSGVATTTSARARALLGKELVRRRGARRRPRHVRHPTTSTGTTRCGCCSRSAASFSPDALTGMEANLRFPGPETMETKIFARLTAWQNWIFQRPNAVGPDGALQRFGTGLAADIRQRSECG